MNHGCLSRRKGQGEWRGLVKKENTEIRLRSHVVENIWAMIVEILQVF